MIGQFGELTTKQVNAPFVLCALALVGVSSLGDIFYYDKIAKSNPDHNRVTFCAACDRVDERFTRTPPKKFKLAFVERWPEHERPCSASEVMYTFFRNTLLHGYWGRGVFMTGKLPEKLLLRDDGCVLLDPEWFYDRFLKSVDWHIAEMKVDNSASVVRRNAVNYVQRLVERPARSAET
jgi:hypothetical protein